MMRRIRPIVGLAGIGAMVALVGVSGCSGGSAWEVEHQLEIDAGAEVVWPILADLQRYGEWNPYSRRVDGELIVGSTVVVEAHLHDEVRQVENVITRVEPPYRLCWQSTDWYGWLVRGTRCREIVPIESGRIRLRHHEIMEGPLAGLVESIYRERIIEGIELVDEAIKQTAESRARQGASSERGRSDPRIRSERAGRG
jgi:hypothetical protein